MTSSATMQKSDGTRVRIALRRAAAPVKSALAGGWRAVLQSRGLDDTRASASRRCLVLAPHPDDETLGCGATLARKAAVGTDVRVVVMTDGRGSHRSEVVSPGELVEIRAEECRRAIAALGLQEDSLVLLGLPEGSLDPADVTQVALVADALRQFQPDEVLVTSCLDWHGDHRALHGLLVQALEEDTVDRSMLALSYPIWAWADGPWSQQAGRGAMRAALDLVVEPLTTALSARPLLVAAGVHLEAKRAAVAEYRSQTTNLTGERTWAVMGDDLLARFLRPTEMFLPLDWGRR